ncbi:MAG: hypothetical protein Q4F05_16265 [bacterium]|nr:hypothetical protein [bacterium]
MKKKIRAILIMSIFAGVVIGMYYMMSNSSKDRDSIDIPQTKVEKLLAKDLEIDYPATVKTVMNLYSQYSKCFYDGDYTEEELPKLLDQYRQLLDDELLANNPLEEQINSLDQEIKAFGGKGKVIISYYWPSNKKTTASASAETTAENEKEQKDEVTYYTKDGVNYASTTIAYTIKQGTKTVTDSREKFVLRQGSDKKWKILGWVLVNDEK